MSGGGANLLKPPLVIDPVALARAPIAPSDKIPFLRAVIQVGRALFGDDWSDAEQVAAKLAHPVASADALTQLLKPKRRPPHPDSIVRLPPLLADPAPPETDPQFAERKRAAGEAHAAWSAEQEASRQRLEQARQDYQARYEANQAAVRRVETAFTELRQSILDRRVAAFWRLNKPGAAFSPLPIEQLLNEHANLHLRGYIWWQPDRCARHVFVDAAGLAAAFPLTPKVDAPAGINPSELSKYLQLALHVHQLGFGPDYRGEKKLIMRALVQAAPQFGLKLSAQQEEYLAMFLRNEDAQAGKNRRKHG